ncbi:hypothetical protein CAPTEDRAFT_211048 [Capitella teleta]|uniref:Uncharacterized protein n=1 Tax=Capitella teleta TaxID=283909 RepID=R7V7Z1_CAPTE|nr:hypothetical protein CAPTEDRAFT_211048 [Capitella teleta]|eukprot:ELU14612.1 hypothetical protein CAPTEDRAFT_211048 [Capitella teleta]
MTSQFSTLFLVVMEIRGLAYMHADDGIQAFAVCGSGKHFTLILVTGKRGLHSIDLISQIKHQVEPPAATELESADMIFSDLLEEGGGLLKPFESGEIILHVTKESLLGTLHDEVIDLLVFHHLYCILLIEANCLKFCSYQEQTGFITPQNKYDISYGETTGRLFLVYPESYPSLSSKIITEDNRIFSLGNSLFNQLFDYDANLLNLMMAVVLTENGCVYAVPVTINSVQVTPRLLYDLQQQACQIHLVNADTLAITGKQGKLLLISSGEQVAKYEEHQLPGDVSCSLVYKQHLLFTCGRELMWTDLSWLLRENAPSAEVEVHVVSCNFFNVQSMIIMNPIGWAEEKRACIMAATTRGCLQHLGILFSSQVLHPAASPSFVSSSSSILKDKVTSISQISEQEMKLEEVMKAQQNVISQLAIAGSLLCSQMVTVSSSVDITDYGWNKKYNVLVTVNNASPHVMSDGWCLVASLSPLNDSTQPGLQKSLAFGSLSSGCSATMAFEVDADFMIRFPLELAPLLNFNANTRFISDDLKNACLSIPFPKRMFQVFDFMHSVQGDGNTLLPSAHLLKHISSVITSKRSNQTSSSNDSDCTKPITISHQVTKSQLKSIFQKGCSEGDILQEIFKGNAAVKLDQSTCLQVANFYNQQSNITVQKTSGGFLLTNNSCHFDLLPQCSQALQHWVQKLGNKVTTKDVPLGEVKRILSKYEEISEQIEVHMDKSLEVHNVQSLYEAMRNIH